jgi:hypothetical protein
VVWYIGPIGVVLTSGSNANMMRDRSIDKGLIMVPIEQYRHTPLCAGLDDDALARITHFLSRRAFTQGANFDYHSNPALSSNLLGSGVVRRFFIDTVLGTRRARERAYGSSSAGAHGRGANHGRTAITNGTKKLRQTGQGNSRRSGLLKVAAASWFTRVSR